MRLSDKLSIDVWKIIADSVQELKIDDFSDEEFNENLMMLGKSLLEFNISFDFLSRYPNSVEDIGLASLLQEIYSARVYDDYKKANFYEKIYQLDKLGIPKIQYLPVGFPLRVDGVSLLIDNGGEIRGIRNCFTDGNFDIGYPDEPLDRWYDMVNLKNANYVFNILIDKNDNGNFLNHDESYIVLKNFNGVFPNKETIYDVRYPGLCMYSNEFNDSKKHYILKQFFFPIDSEKIKYPKRLVRMKNNYHYE